MIVTDALEDRVARLESIAPISPDELRSSRIPDYSLVGVQLKFVHEGGKYFLVYTGQEDHWDGSLEASNARKSDFRSARKKVKSATGVPFEIFRFTDERGVGKYRSGIWVFGEMTQERTANIIDKLRDDFYFKSVRLSKLIFANVPMSAFENPGLPREKLAPGYN